MTEHYCEVRWITADGKPTPHVVPVPASYRSRCKTAGDGNYVYVCQAHYDQFVHRGVQTLTNWDFEELKPRDTTLEDRELERTFPVASPPLPSSEPVEEIWLSQPQRALIAAVLEEWGNEHENSLELETLSRLFDDAKSVAVRK